MAAMHVNAAKDACLGGDEVPLDWIEGVIPFAAEDFGELAPVIAMRIEV